jgi:L-aspartate oxidase
MGGVRTDADGQTSLKRLYAAGEAACTGVHGANRLASNSLLEGLVFGARAAEKMREEPALTAPVVPESAAQRSSAEDTGDLLRRLQQVMWQKAGLLRDASGLREAKADLADICVRLSAGRTRAALELRNLHAIANLIVRSALAREESRGAHYRNDFPKRNDTNFQKHSVLCSESDTVSFTADSCCS